MVPIRIDRSQEIVCSAGILPAIFAGAETTQKRRRDAGATRTSAVTFRSWLPGLNAAPGTIYRAPTKPLRGSHFSSSINRTRRFS
jgi:hypothetical protein